ncbi:MAG: hypothetical protein JNM99_11635 [Verrucomicrobiaceae bacterium]|nr:hypothetical protein [Verrucomicrobiaceae bacterium]
MASSLAMALVVAHGEPAVEATLRLSEPFREGVSLLWSPTGQDAWDHLKAYHGVKSLELEPRSETSEELDDFVWNPKGTLPSDSFCMAGEFTKEFGNEIRDALAKMIGKQAAAFIEEPPPLGSIPGSIFIREKAAIIVSALVARPKFAGSFQPHPRPRMFSLGPARSHSTLGFGVEGLWAGKMGEGIRVLQDDMNGSIVVEVLLFTGSNDDAQRMVLAMDSQITSMKTGIEVIRKAKANAIAPSRTVESQGARWQYISTLTSVDQFWMPEVRAAVQCEFGDLSGKTYLHTRRGFDDHRWWTLRSVQQLLSLKLDHRGALVEAVFKLPADFTSIAGEPHAPTPKGQQPIALPVYPKRLLFNRPFLMTLWRAKADWPYLAFWVASDGVMRAD